MHFFFNFNHFKWSLLYEDNIWNNFVMSCQHLLRLVIFSFLIFQYQSAAGYVIQLNKKISLMCVHWAFLKWNTCFGDLWHCPTSASFFHLLTTQKPNTNSSFYTSFFRLSSTLHAHKRRHHHKEGEAYKYQCLCCEKQFSTNSGRTHHLEEKSNVCCNVCGNKFDTRASLTKHYKMQHSDIVRKVQCPKCDKVFTTKETMMEH